MTLLRFFACLAVVLTILGGCQPALITEESAQGFDYAIVEADQAYLLTMAEFYNGLRSSKLFPDGGIIGPDQVRGVLDSILLDTLDGFDAAHVRLEDNYELLRQYRTRYREKLIGTYLDEFVYSKVEADSQTVADFYFSRPDLFTQKEQALIYHILVSPKGLLYGPDSLKYQNMPRPQLEKEAEEKARRLLDIIDSPEKFKEIAATESHDTTGGGFVGWALRGVYLHPFDSVAFSLKPGEWSRPYYDSYGWHILYVEDYIPERIPPLDSAKFEEALANYKILQSNRIGAALMDTLLDEIDIRYNEALLDTNLYYVDVHEWVAIVNGVDTIDCNDARGAELFYRRQSGVDNTSAQMKKEMLRQPAQVCVVAQAARVAGIDTLPEVMAEEKSLQHKYRKTIVKRSYEIDPYWKAPDNAVEQYYQQHLAEFQPAKPMKVQHIIVQDSLFGDFLRDQAMSGYEFLDLAQEHYPGDQEVRRELADLGWIGENDVSKEFWDAAKRTALGEVSYPVKTQYGYHIIKVIERYDRKSIDQVGPQIQLVLKDQERVRLVRERLNSLIEKYNVKFPGKIARMHLEPLRMRTPLN